MIPNQITEAARNRIEEVWTKIYEMALSLCPVDTGSLVSTIRLISGGDLTENSGETIGGGLPMVGEGASIYNGIITVGDPTVVNPKNHQPTSVYANMVHDGHFNSGGGYIQGVPFLTDAIDAYEGELMEAIEDALHEAGVE